MITAFGNVDAAVNALKAGAFDFVSKPVDLAVLRRLVQTALKLGEQRKAETQGSNDKLIGQSACHAVGAPNHCQGRAQPGTGLHPRRVGYRQGTGRAHDPRSRAARCRSLRAGQLRRHSLRTDGIRVLRPQEGQLSPVPAPTRKACSRPHPGGTLFLDEVADLPMHMQVKLLRVIQEKALRAVGSTAEIPIDVRVLSATHRDLSKLVEQGQFRQDLFYRINVIEVKVPPLRERIEDIPMLAERYLDRIAPEWGIERRRNSRTPRSRHSRSTVFPATCVNSRTSSNARSPCATTVALKSMTCACRNPASASPRPR
jgi:two-component system response regulator PilR (NtrC family)